nr:Peptidase A1 domain containing protein [Haemonchus contortus]
MLYYGLIYIGIPKQQFRMQFDNDSANLLVPCMSCNISDGACQNHRKFNCQQSTTCNGTKNEFEAEVFDGILGMAWESDAVGGISPPLDQMFADKVTTLKSNSDCNGMRSLKADQMKS